MIITQNILYSFIKENENSFFLKENYTNILKETYSNKKDYIKKYFIFLEKQYLLKEGVIDTIKSFIRFCFKIVSDIKSILNKLKNKVSGTKLAQITQKDKDIKLFFSMGSSFVKGSIKTLLLKKTPFWMIFTKTSSLLTFTLKMVGVSSILPSAITSFVIGSVSFVVMYKVIGIITKFFSIVIGAIKKWSNFEDKEKVEQEALQLAQLSIQANKQIINKLNGEKKIKAQEKLKEKITKINQYKKQINSKNQKNI